MVEPKAEEDILCSLTRTGFTRTGSYATRQHRENVGALVTRLFVQTDDLEMEYIKLEVFRESELKAGRGLWRKSTQRCKSSSREAPVTCYLPCCALCSQKTLSASTFTCRQEV